ncbi:hypothetical protein SBRCBS47491_001476 [Sporothrix bragantina]|uniref:Zn 2cys6 transcription factor n=1 Tax=Sporothrix bragantina TaxID=671064 RepID=A0ABP0AZD8_9PEZI
MGRKPNPIILQFFERGPRLADNSNRYPHRCKACGESFPKGRAESLMTHISKKCPAISEADRINACLSLNGLSHHIAAAAAASASAGGGNGNGNGMVGSGARGSAASRSQQHLHGLQQHAHRLAAVGGANGGLSQTHAHHHHLLAASNSNNAAAAAAAAAAVAAAAAAVSSSSPSTSAVDAAAIQRDWTALETLAEVSRQIDLSEKHDDRAPGSAGGGNGDGDASTLPATGPKTPAKKNGAANDAGVLGSASSANHFDPSDLLRSDPNTMEEDTDVVVDKKPMSEQQQAEAEKILVAAEHDGITLDQIKRLEEANLSMAAAQLSQSLLDPQLRTDEPVATAAAAVAAAAAAAATASSNNAGTPQSDMAAASAAVEKLDVDSAAATSTNTPAPSNMAETAVMTPDVEVHTSADGDEPMPDALLAATTGVDAAAVAATQPWGELTYVPDNVLSIFPSGDAHHPNLVPTSPGDPNRISFNMNNPNEVGRPKQGRARFNTTRRKEVQEVRRIGACIRCRILRKTCSKGSPCDQCRKVLSPRVWRSGCVRTKFTEQLDIFCAGVQVVLAQHRANQLRETVDLVNNGLMIEATHFPDNPAVAVTLEVFQSNGPKDPGAADAAAAVSSATAADVAAAAAAAAAAVSAAAAAAAGVARVDGAAANEAGNGDGAAVTTETATAEGDAATAAPEAADASVPAESTGPVAEAAPAPAPATIAPLHLWEKGEIVMVDTAKDDVPLKMEYYMRNMLPEFIQREPSLFVRTMLETATALAQETNSVLLKKAIELWGLVEILDRERQWQIRVKPIPGITSTGKPKAQDEEAKEGDVAGDDAAGGAAAVATTDDEARQIRADTDQETYTTLCLQLTAGAERKAAAISNSLLTTMQRLLQDSKTKIDYTMYFTTLILLNCVEKSTWGFKAWDQETLREMWPLERTPHDFAQQGYVIADLLRMLLSIRKALPRTTCRAEDGMLVTEDDDPVIRNFFETIKLNYTEVMARHNHPMFSPTDSRSFELLFCSSLLVSMRD